MTEPKMNNLPRSRRTSAIAGMVAAAAIAVGTTVGGAVLPQAAGVLPAASADVPTGTYNVTISGTTGGNSFTRDATIYVAKTISSVGTTNGVNPQDVCLVSGFPAGNPQVGAIRVGSNTGCMPGSSAADLDMGYVSVSGSTITYKPDARLGAVQGNNFTSSNNYISSCAHIVLTGSMNVTVSGGRATGSIDVSSSGDPYCGATSYQATIR